MLTHLSTHRALTNILQFENDQGALPLVAANPVNLYLDIFFNGWEAFVAGTGGVVATGVAPQSPPNVTGYGSIDVATILQGTAVLTTVYPDTTINHFDFNSFFFGCVLSSQESAAGVPQSCTVTVTGLDKNGKQVAKQSFNFVANALSQQMIKATLVGFTGLQTATFSTSSKLVGAVPENATVTTLGDTFSYTVYSQNPISP